MGGSVEVEQWYPDERDEFITWVKCEFAASNAMIDCLCHHLMLVGEPGEYDGVVFSIQERRSNWNPVLHMQQFFSISHVFNALHQAALRRQQHGSGRKNAQRADFLKANGEKIVQDKRETVGNLPEDSSMKNQEVTQVTHSCEPDIKSLVDREGQQNGTVTAKSFVANEMLGGKAVNVVDGMEMYDKLLDISEVNKIVSLVNDMRAAGKKGELQGHTFVWSKRPMKGHGREMIQLGLADTFPEGENITRGSKDRNMLPIPQLLQDVIDRLVCTQVLSVKPDSCVIDVFNVGDHSQPQMWPSWYGRPVSVLFLTQCELTFGKLIESEYPGDYKGSLELSLQPGICSGCAGARREYNLVSMASSHDARLSLLVMQGNSANLAKYAMSSFKKQRILVTLTKLQPRKPAPNDSHHLASAAAAPIPHWFPPPSRSPNHVRHPMPKHYLPIVTNGVLPAQPVRPPIGPPNGAHPIFVPPPVAPAVPFRAPFAMPPRLLLPGTGVFIPPGSNNSAEPVKENGLANPNESKLSNKSSHKECNDIGASGSETVVTKEKQQQDVEPQTGTQATRKI